MIPIINSSNDCYEYFNYLTFFVLYIIITILHCDAVSNSSTLRIKKYNIF
jgi:hypothetical protein